MELAQYKFHLIIIIIILNTLAQLVSDVIAFAESAIYILYFQITSQLKEMVCYIRLPIGFFFHAVSHEIYKEFYCH